MSGYDFIYGVSQKVMEYINNSIRANLPNRVIDLSNCLLDTNFNDINKLAKVNMAIYERHSKSNVAIIAAHNVTYGLVRMYDSLCKNSNNGERKIFKQISDAEGWLADLKNKTNKQLGWLTSPLQ